MSDERSEPEITLSYIGRGLNRLAGAVASLRDDVHVLTGIVQRLDNAQERLLEELRHRFEAQS